MLVRVLAMRSAIQSSFGVAMVAGGEAAVEADVVADCDVDRGFASDESREHALVKSVANVVSAIAWFILCTSSHNAGL